MSLKSLKCWCWILLFFIGLIELTTCQAQKPPIPNQFKLTNWHFQVDIFNIGEKEKWFKTTVNKSNWAKVQVPAAWETYDEALWGYEGIGWYYTNIDGIKINRQAIVYLLFERVNYFSKVWLNNRLIVQNDNGFLPFEVDITDFIKKDTLNTLVLKVDNRPDLNHLPAAKQIEWVQYGGILQNVWLLQFHKIHIKDVDILPQTLNNKAKVHIVVTIENRYSSPQKIVVEAEISKSIKKVNVNCPPHQTIALNLSIDVPNPLLWSPKTPNLYKLKLKIKQNNKIIDFQAHRFGFRNLSVLGRKILLNSEPLYLKGVNRYDIFDRQGPVLNAQQIRHDLIKIKQTGANIIRVHYPQSPLTLDLLDELGLMIIEELPLNWWGQNWWDNSEVTQDTAILQQARKILKRMIKRDKHHPSIIAWSVGNECKTQTKIGTYVFKKLINLAHQLDKTRLVTFSVNDEVNRHQAFEQADFISCNIYFGNDEAYHRNLLDSLVKIPSEKMIRKQAACFPNKPLIISEFGAAGIFGIYGDVIFSEDWQAEYIKKVWEAIRNVSECSGGILWCWRDYYHRKYFLHTYAPFGPYGVLNSNGLPKKAFFSLKEMFTLP